MVEPWDASAPGVLRLPSGRLVRGRALGLPLPDGVLPTFALYLFDEPPPAVSWEHWWVPWPDFGLPGDPFDAAGAFQEAWRRALLERVEIACRGGAGRTGTALACLAVLDGVPASRAVAYVRDHYGPRAVETPEQEEYVARFTGQEPGTRRPTRCPGSGAP